MTTRATTRLRQLLSEKGCIVAPGVYNPLTAKMAEAAGFEAVYISGYGIHVTHFGLPNVGIVTMTEVAEFAERIANAIDIPVVLAAEAGFGGPLEIRRAVNLFEAAGVAAIHVNDQVRGWTTHASVKADLLSVEAMQAKVESAKEAQRDPDFVFIGRTDAAAQSVEEAINRCNAYVEAGADLAMPMMSSFLSYTGAQTPREARNDVLKQWVKEIHAPVVTHSPFGLDLTPDEAADCGIALYVIPQACLGYSAAASWAALNALKAGTLERFASDHPPHPLTGDNNSFAGLVGTADYMELAKKYGL